MKKLKIILPLARWSGFRRELGSAQHDTNTPAWLTRPLSLADALNTALQQNATILKAQKRPRSVARPRGADARRGAAAVEGDRPIHGRAKSRSLQNFPFPGSATRSRTKTGTRASRSSSPFTGRKHDRRAQGRRRTRQQALAQYQTTVADTLLTVRLAYYDVLLAAQQITVHEASVNLLQKELEDQQHRLDAGTVPQFNVLRAEVAVANERPNSDSARATIIASPKTTCRTCSATICRATSGRTFRST